MIPSVQAEHLYVSSSFSSFQDHIDKIFEYLSSKLRPGNPLLYILQRIKSLLESILELRDTETSSDIPPDDTTTENPPVNEEDTGEENFPPPPVHLTENDTPSNKLSIPPQDGYDYPRLSLNTNWVQDWLKPELVSLGYGLGWLYQFQEIYTYTATQQLHNVQQQARNDGHSDWVESTLFIMQECFLDRVIYEEKPPNWVYTGAQTNPFSAIDIAIYENSIRGVDWFMRDIFGNRILVWRNGYAAIDISPWCPPGAWDGTYTVDGVPYDIGDTRGKTLVEWMNSEMKEKVLFNSLWAEVWDGLQSEDWPSGWTFTFNGDMETGYLIPNLNRDGVTWFSANQIDNLCSNYWELEYYEKFWGDLTRNGFITRYNGNNFRWLHDDWENPRPGVQAHLSGAKFERLGRWGGWPNYDWSLWWNCYNWLQEYYKPLGDSEEFETRQGWDISTMQINVNKDWTDPEKEKYKRLGLAFTLMGDATADLYAHDKDYSFCAFLRKGQDSENAPHGIPEMQFHLGKALGEYQIDNRDPSRPLYYRRFYNHIIDEVYTVVVNFWTVTTNAIPSRDGMWFRGEWPDGSYAQLFTE